MQAREVVKRVSALVEPICDAVGVSLWDVEFEKEGGQYMLIVTIDRDDGVNTEHCETVSRALDPLLDAKEFDAMPSYTLCVSSAGLERRLKKPAHFEKFIGAPVEVKFYKQIDGAKTVEGILAGYEDGFVTLDTNGKRCVYEPKDIAAVRLTVQF